MAAGLPAWSPSWSSEHMKKSLLKVLVDMTASSCPVFAHQLQQDKPEGSIMNVE